MNESKHLIFKEGPSKPKTKTWWVVNKHSDICIGNIGWFATWRKYSFFPKPDIVFEEDCLRDIADFCETKTKEHKGKSLRANIVGSDWETSWWNENPDDSTTKQIIRDLNTELHPDLAIGEILAIDREDRTLACETFEVISIFRMSGIVKLEYRGGAS